MSTILIPTYNRAEYLRKAIASALAQTYAHTEVIVLDDASLDHTPAVVAEFVDIPHLRYVRHPNNVGIVENWKAGIRAATGDFFCFLHDDDTFEPSFVETLAQPLMRDESLMLASCDHWVMDENGQRTVHESDKISGRFKRDSLREGCLEHFDQSALLDMSLPVGATLFRKSMVSEDFLSSHAKGSIDAWLFYQCVKSGHSAYYVPQRLMNYRAHTGGMSASMPLYMCEGHIYRYRTILADKSFIQLHPAIRKKLGETLSSYGISLLHGGRRDEARQALSEALRLTPTPRGVAAYGLAYSGTFGTRVTAALKRA